MTSTILSALSEETVLHSNSLATVTVRPPGARTQTLVAIASLSAVKTTKTVHLTCLAFSAGCVLIAIATECSKEAAGLTLPFALVGLALLGCAQFTRQASVAFVVASDTVYTPFGSLPEAATLVAAVRFVQEGIRRGRQPSYPQFLVVRAYLALLV
jgi:hypothetical protein